ncbi:MAG: hypothetical protein IKT02_07425 [Bacteroidales bacterium]|nr:hypothetical protein [Bacteroidales bacterium]
MQNDINNNTEKDSLKEFFQHIELKKLPDSFTDNVMQKVREEESLSVNRNKSLLVLLLVSAVMSLLPVIVLVIIFHTNIASFFTSLAINMLTQISKLLRPNFLIPFIYISGIVISGMLLYSILKYLNYSNRESTV